MAGFFTQRYYIPSYKVKVSVTDGVADYLGVKLVAGSNITITKVTSGGVETLQFDSSGGGGGTPGGSTTQLQYNNAGAFGGISNVTSDGTTLSFVKTNVNFTYETAPTAPTIALVATSSGNCTNGTHSVKVTFVSAQGETEGGTVSSNVTVDGTHKQIALTSIPLGTTGTVTGRNIYLRKNSDANNWWRLGTGVTINDNTTTTLTVNISDTSVSSITAPVYNTTGGNIIAPKQISYRTSAGVSPTAYMDVGTGLYFSTSFTTDPNITGNEAFGRGTIATGGYATAMGHAAAATQTYSMALGSNTTASDYYAVAIGYNAQATASITFAIGVSARSTYPGSFAAGYLAYASATGATAIGQQSSATYDGTTAIGLQSSANHINATAIGYYASAVADYAIVIGSNSSVTSANGIAIGYGASASNVGSIVFGQAQTFADNQFLVPPYDFYLGGGRSATPTVSTYNGVDAYTVSDTTGGSVSLNSGKSTGIGDAGDIVSQWSGVTTSSSSTPNALIDAMRGYGTDGKFKFTGRPQVSKALSNPSNTTNYLYTTTGYPANGSTIDWRLYSYKNVGAGKVYSSTYLSFTETDNNSTTSISGASSANVTQTTGTGSYVANGQYFGYYIWAYEMVNGVKCFCAGNSFYQYTDSINDGSTNFQNDITWTFYQDAYATSHGFIIQRDINGNGFADYIDIGNTSSYTDNGSNSGWTLGSQPAITPTTVPSFFTEYFSWTNGAGNDGKKLVRSFDGFTNITTAQVSPLGASQQPFSGYFTAAGQFIEYQVWAYQTLKSGFVFASLAGYLSMYADYSGDPFGVQLDWNAVTFDSSAITKGYILQRQVSAGGYNDYIDLGNIITYLDDGTNSGWTVGSQPTLTPTDGNNNEEHTITGSATDYHDSSASYTYPAVVTPTLSGYTITQLNGPTSSLKTINSDSTVGLNVFANNAAAIAAGLAAGDFYRTGNDPDLVCIVH